MSKIEDLLKLEQVVLSHLLNNPKLYFNNLELFEKQLFRQNQECNKIFKAFQSLVTEGIDKPDVIAISERSGIDLLLVSDIFSNVDYQFDFSSSVQKIIEYAIYDNLVILSNDISRGVRQKTDVFQIIRMIKDSIGKLEANPVQRHTTIKENIEHLKEHIKSRQENKISGIITGIAKWDAFTGGLQPTDLIVIAGETSQGKTSLALTIAYNATVNTNAKCLIFSLEMSSLQLTARLAAMETKIPSKKILFSVMNHYDASAISNMTLLPEANIYLDECSQSNVDYIINGIKIANMRYGIQFVIVDYLQLIHSGNKNHNEETEIATNTRKLKNIAKELNITVILISQLRRNPNSPKPTIARLRGSGQIEEAADIIALVYRPEVYNIDSYEDSDISTTGTAEISIEKGRNIGLAKFYLKYEPMFTYFSNLDY